MRKFLFVRTEVFRLPHGANFSFGGKKIFQAGKIFFPPKENISSSEGKKSALRKEKRFLPKGEKFPCAQK